MNSLEFKRGYGESTEDDINYELIADEIKNIKTKLGDAFDKTYPNGKPGKTKDQWITEYLKFLTNEEKRKENEKTSSITNHGWWLTGWFMASLTCLVIIAISIIFANGVLKDTSPNKMYYIGAGIGAVGLIITSYFMYKSWEKYIQSLSFVSNSS
jgi:hypothetical protein